MNVKLISLTKAEFDIDGRVPTAEELVVYIARVSNPSNQDNLDTSEKLINYCIKNHHWSIFEQINIGIEVTTSIPIAEQMIRHWTLRPQKFSGRYAAFETMEPIEFRLKAETNRQSSSIPVGTVEPFAHEICYSAEEGATEDTKMWLSDVSDTLDQLFQLYRLGIDLGIANETLRMMLPMATSTTMYLTGPMRTWIHYLKIRQEKHTQKEHREVAAAIQGIFVEQFPIISKALGWL